MCLSLTTRVGAEGDEVWLGGFVGFQAGWGRWFYLRMRIVGVCHRSVSVH